MPTVPELIEHVKTEFPGWAVKQDEMVVARAARILTEFVDGDVSRKNSIGNYNSYVAHFRLKKFVSENIDTAGNYSDFIVSAELGMRPLFYAIAVLKENTNAAVLFSDYAENLAQKGAR